MYNDNNDKDTHGRNYFFKIYSNLTQFVKI